jgi:hypothetical protein
LVFVVVEVIVVLKEVDVVIIHSSLDFPGSAIHLTYVIKGVILEVLPVSKRTLQSFNKTLRNQSLAQQPCEPHKTKSLSNQNCILRSVIEPIILHHHAD